ncbi:hypothetical protein SAMN05444416_107184 [Thermoactinomyces sp. DSM 45892]|nr:hypothetical protein SAMN05444416_107184 [Thermoactinomyces sp. DSM 45892]
MVELEVTGSKLDIELFLYELYRSSSVRILEQKIGIKIEGDIVKHCAKCIIRYLPVRRMNLLQIIDIFRVVKEESEDYEFWKKLKEAHL